MTNLITTRPGELAGRVQPLVDARELHQQMSVGRDFSAWIKGRIETYGFAEGQDYLCGDSPGVFDKSTENPNPSISTRIANVFSNPIGRPRIDYTLTLGMAKELAMIENNDLGRKIRRDLIALEHQFSEHRAAVGRDMLSMAVLIEQLQHAVLGADSTLASVLRYTELGLSTTEQSKLLGCSTNTIWRRKQQLDRLQFKAVRMVNPLALPAAPKTRTRLAAQPQDHQQGSLSLGEVAA